MTKIEFVLPEGDQIDLECTFRELMLARAAADSNFARTNPWGEYQVLQGKILHGIQWSFIGEEEYDEEIDFEVDCSWHITENYVEGEDYDE